jgi:hypothetical protein
MSRVQLALNVADIDEAVAFYSRLFAAAPSKRRPGYANFAIADPPLKLVLFENADAPSRLNHLGVEVMSIDEVAAHQARLTNEGLDPVDESGTCCYAKQDKAFGESSAHVAESTQSDDAACCDTMPESAARCC